MSSPAWNRRRANRRRRREVDAVLAWLDATGVAFVPWQRTLLVELLVARPNGARWSALGTRGRS